MMKVLMIDDEEVVLDVSKLFLERQGNISVDCVSSASKGMEKLLSEKYDAVICDYDMDEIDGISFLKAVRGIYPGINSPCPEIPFIIFTGKGDECVVIEALNCGADYYLQKGNDPRGQLLELTHKIEDIVNRRCNEEIMDAAFENTGTCMVILDDENNVIRMNMQMYGVLGISKPDEKEESVPVKPDIFVCKENLESFAEFLSGMRKNCGYRRSEREKIEFNLCRDGKEKLPVSANAVYIPEKKVTILSIRII